MKKILSVILGLALCCMLAALPFAPRRPLPPCRRKPPKSADGYVTLVSDSNQLIPVYVDEEAEGAGGTVEQMMSDFSVGGTIMGLINDSGIYDIIKGNWKSAVMILISFVLLYLAIVKQFEPLLLMPIAFGMLLTNLPLAGIMDEPIYEIISNPTYHGKAGIPIYNGDMLVGYQYIKQNGGLLYYLYQGVKLGIFPPLIFMGVGAMTDFGPLIANPMSLLLGAAAQLASSWRSSSPCCWVSRLLRPVPSGIIGGRGRPDRDLRYHETGSRPARPDRHRRVFVHGVGAGHSAADHEGADQQEGSPDRHGSAAHRLQDREDRLPDRRYRVGLPDAAERCAADRFADAGQPVQGVRRDGASFQDRAERADEHRYHLPGRDGRRDCEG